MTAGYYYFDWSYSRHLEYDQLLILDLVRQLSALFGFGSLYGNPTTREVP